MHSSAETQWSAALAIEERYTTIASIEEQPQRECDDNYAEVDEPAKKTQLGGGDNNHFYFILEGIKKALNLQVLGAIGSLMEEQPLFL